ncbi:MAG TPA: helix-turn-helix domain-containing protein [Thermomicrobiales bacterium]|nr:helix-turn-helix domain-containing protein [Thermomicrobiales bacterium]
MNEPRTRTAPPDDHTSAFCPVYHHAIELIGKRWTGAILRAMLSGATRFSDVTAAVPGLSDRLLSERLKELEAEGIVTRTVIPSTPVKIEYRLTPKGRALNDVIASVSEWAGSWTPPSAEDPRAEDALVEPAGVTA